MFITSDKLLFRLRHHLNDTQRIDIAMAWAGLGAASEAILNFADKHPGHVRSIIGISQNFTHPSTLKQFSEQTNLRIPNNRPMFHVKMIIFYKQSCVIAWIGSANLTRCGFEQNTEIMLETKECADSMKWFDQVWASLPSDRRIIENYIKTWTPPYISTAAQLESSSIINKQTLRKPEYRLGSWESFLQALVNANKYWSDRLGVTVDGEQSSWINTIHNGKEIVWRENWETLSKIDYCWLLGISNIEDDPVGYGFLGSMRGAGVVKNVFLVNNDQNISIRSDLRRALDPVLQSNQNDFPRHAGQFLEFCCSIDRFGGAIGTRIMALGRPDLAISVNRGSINGLAKMSGLPKTSLNKPPAKTGLSKSYVDLLKFFANYPWYKNPKPKNMYEEQIARSRAALIDCLVYQIDDM